MDAGILEPSGTIRRACYAMERFRALFRKTPEVTDPALSPRRTRTHGTNQSVIPQGDWFLRAARAGGGTSTLNADGQCGASTHAAQAGFRAVHTRRPCQINACPTKVHCGRGTTCMRSRSIATASFVFFD